MKNLGRGTPLFTKKTLSTALYTSAAFAMAAISPASAMSLQEAIQKALTTNPQISQAVENREAVEFELRQARGLYLPSIDLEASVGQRRLSNNSTGTLTRDYENFNSSEVGLTVTQRLLDGGGRRAQVDQQASRVDGASFRVLERSETIALQVVQDYLEYILQSKIVGVAQQNVSFHNGILADINQGISGGALTEVDAVQGRERLAAAQARLREAKEELELTKIRFLKTVGEPIANAKVPASVAKSLPRNLQDAIAAAKANNPRIYSARADIDAADAAVRAARSNYAPTLDLEGRASVGNDVGSSQGNTNDVQVRLVARWNLYRGGIDQAREQERIRRASEQRFASDQVHREIEESVRSAWNERSSRGELAQILNSQSSQNAQLVSSYSEQFKIGQRSLLDVLDAQNTRFNTSIIAETARVAALFAEYKILAASGSLLKTMNVKPVNETDAYARNEFTVKTTPNGAYVERDSRQKAGIPMDLLAPLQ